VLTKSSPPSLFSKLASIMRSPSSRRTDSRDTEPSRHSDLDTKILRERIESKRRDDSIRRKEFNYLRQMLVKRQLATAGHIATSTFQGSSSFNQVDRRLINRAATVKKIDAIEASMAEQWIRRKQPAAEAPTLTDSIRPHTPLAKVAAAPKAASIPTPTFVSRRGADTNFDLDFTGLSSDLVALSATPPQVSEVEGIPALQTAAMRFAEGDIAAAQSALQAVISDESAPIYAIDQCALALVDMYRGQGDAARFDAVAIDYAQRFGRSAPEWYSVPQLLGHAAPQSTRRSTPRDDSLWACPPLLDAAAVARLAATQNARDTRMVSWGQLEAVDQDAVKPLTSLLAQWSKQTAKIMFDGLGVLNAVLQALTPMNDRQVAPERWLLRLEVLRLQGLHEDYETVAMDYCVTYEVSPPSWSVPISVCEAITPEARANSVLPDMEDVAPSVPQGASGFGNSGELVLQGELLGDAALAIEQIMAKVHPGDPIVIDCHNLIRVDFAAAGRLLNWLAQNEGAHLLVEFVNMPRLVNVFFQDMGISEFAEVSVSLK
jgi:ABC-type transporter Mla MlaB component